MAEVFQAIPSVISRRHYAELCEAARHSENLRYVSSQGLPAVDGLNWASASTSNAISSSFVANLWFLDSGTPGSLVFSRLGIYAGDCVELRLRVQDRSIDEVVLRSSSRSLLLPSGMPWSLLIGYVPSEKAPSVCSLVYPLDKPTMLSFENSLGLLNHRQVKMAQRPSLPREYPGTLLSNPYHTMIDKGVIAWILGIKENSVKTNAVQRHLDYFEPDHSITLGRLELLIRKLGRGPLSVADNNEKKAKALMRLKELDESLVASRSQSGLEVALTP